MSTLTAKIHLPVFVSIEVIEGDVLSFNFVSVIIEGVEYVEYFDFPCVGWCGLVCVVICLEKIVWEVEISFVAANVVVSPRLDLFLCETGIPTVDKEATYLYVVSDDGGNELGVVTVDSFGGLAGFETFVLYHQTTFSY